MQSRPFWVCRAGHGQAQLLAELQGCMCRPLLFTAVNGRQSQPIVGRQSQLAACMFVRSCVRFGMPVCPSCLALLFASACPLLCSRPLVLRSFNSCVLFRALFLPRRGGCASSLACGLCCFGRFSYAAGHQTLFNIYVYITINI